MFATAEATARYAGRFPGWLASDAQRAIQFTRPAPGIAVVLAGMGTPAHVLENLGVVGATPAAPEQFRRFFRC